MYRVESGLPERRIKKGHLVNGVSACEQPFPDISGLSRCKNS